MHTHIHTHTKLKFWYDADINANMLHKHVPDHKIGHVANFTPTERQHSQDPHI
jgi:outer membrane protease